MDPELSLFGKEPWYHTEAASTFPEYFRRQKEKDKISKLTKIKLRSDFL